MSYCRRIQTHPYLSHSTKLKSKWIKDITTKPDTLYLIEEKEDDISEQIGIGDNFLNRTSIVQSINGSSWNVRASVRQKRLPIGHKCSLQSGKGFFTNPISYRGLISKTFKELKKTDRKKFLLERGYSYKQRIFKRGTSHSWETLKGMFNILSYHVNANQNDSEIPSYTCQNGKDNKSDSSCWHGYGARGTLHHCGWK